MSVLIKGVGLPINCRLCRMCDLRYYGDGQYLHTCIFVGSVVEAVAEGVRSEVCPLVEIPTPHGRLIDADRLTRKELIPLFYHLPNGDIAVPLIDIEHAPTVVESEE